MVNCKVCSNVTINNYDHYCAWCKYKALEHKTKVKVVHSLLNQAVKRGKVVKANECEACEAQTYLEAHHAEYDRLYDVVWLCRKCHKELHKFLPMFASS